MFSNDDWRKALGQQGMTDREIEEFRQSLHSFLNTFLDDYFRDEFKEDEDL